MKMHKYALNLLIIVYLYDNNAYFSQKMHIFATDWQNNIITMNNDFKQKLQEREFAVLKDKRRVLLKWATGCGKSKMTIDLINHQCEDALRDHKPVKVLFVVAERAHIQNWEDEFRKWHLKRDRVSTSICCYASLKHYKEMPFDIVVLDEGHHACTPKAYEHLTEMAQFFNTHINNVYLLSATFAKSKQDMMEDIFGKFTISQVTLKEAINKDILPDPKVYVIAMELDNVKRHQEIKIGNDPKAPVIKWEDRKKYIFKNTPCIIQCTEYQKNQFLTEKINYWNERYRYSHSEFQRIQAANTGSQRKRFLGELKTGVVRRLIESFPKGKRFVCFCASVPQANALSTTNTIAAKKGDKYNQAVIDAFNKKDISSIYAVGMITEGMNLTDIEAGIIVQLDGKERLFIQKFGRSLRAEDPVSFIFYYKGTQDENYLRGALENIDSKYVKPITINQLNNIKL